jgi:hypothetical protein
MAQDSHRIAAGSPGTLARMEMAAKSFLLMIVKCPAATRRRALSGRHTFVAPLSGSTEPV